MAQFNALAERFTLEQEELDYRSALICSIIAEVNRDTKKRSKPFTPVDFMPKRRLNQKTAKLTDEQMINQLQAINIALGGEVM